MFPSDLPQPLLLQVKPTLSSCTNHGHGDQIVPTLFMQRWQSGVWLSYARLNFQTFKYKTIHLIYKCTESNLPSLSHMEFVMSFLKYLLSDYNHIWNMWLLCNQTIKKPKQTRLERLCCETWNIQECYGLEFTAAGNKLEEVLWLRHFLY